MGENPGFVGAGTVPMAADYVVALAEFAAERGVTPQRVLEGTQIPLRALVLPGARIGDLAIRRVSRNVIEALDDPLLAVEFGQSMSLADHGLLGAIARNSKTLMEAARHIVRYGKTRTGVDGSFELLADEHLARLRLHVPDLGDDHVELECFYALSTLINLETLGRRLLGAEGELGPELAGAEISIAYPAPGEIPASALSPGLTLRFDGPVNELRMPVEYLQTPLPRANAALADAAEEAIEAELSTFAGAGDTVALVRLRIRQAQGPIPNIARVAEQLSMSTRTLKRRLADAGTTYQQIKDSERFRKAIHLLESSDVTLETIAEALGYSNASNFNKAFKNWAGESPGSYRAKLAR